MKLRIIFSIFLLSIFSLPAIANENDTLNSADVVKNTLLGAPSCLKYHVTGVCLWRKCDGPICWIEPTPELDHYLPDTVVTVHNTIGDNPWLYANKVLDPIEYRLGLKVVEHETGFELGSGQESEDSLADLDNHFKEVDVIGNPALAVFDVGHGVLLQSTATPYTPYYSSFLDAYAWRYPALERFYPGSVIPGLHDVGTMLLHEWGPIYPRTGFVDQPDDAKAAAVIAMRATHMVTREAQPHIYIPLSNYCGQHCQAAPVTENNTDTQWQMVYPIASKVCMDFGHSDAFSFLPWGSVASMKGRGRYAWILWRRYQGCVQDPGGSLVKVIHF